MKTIILIILLTPALLFGQLRQSQINIRAQIEKRCIYHGLTDYQINIVKQIAFRESSYRKNVLNPSGSSAGIFGQRKILVKEVNRLIGAKKYKYKDRYNLNKSIEMLIIFMDKRNPSWEYKRCFTLWNSSRVKSNNEKYFELIENEKDIALK